MPSHRQVAASKAIHRRTGKTFYLATRFLPRRVRRDTYVLYGFFRTADEVVDDVAPGSAAEQRRRLAAIRDAVLGPGDPADPVLAAFREVRAEAGIDEADVEAFLDAMERDVATDSYETFEDLVAYMDGSAAAVGRMMTAVMDPADPSLALPHATALGEAFQLTNFVRDVREDVLDRDRVYLPADVLGDHGASVEQVRRLEFDDCVADAVRDVLSRTERRYRTGVAGIEYLPEDCRFPVLLAAVLYADHHRLVRDLDYDVLSTRPSLSTRRKLSLCCRSYLQWLRHRDPVTVFDALTGVGSPSAGPGTPTRPDPVAR